jgi:hypothetical protein
MTARKKSKQNARTDANASNQTTAASELETQFLPPFKPHPRLAIILGIALVLWLGTLIVLKVTTVHPAPSRAVETDRTLTH